MTAPSWRPRLGSVRLRVTLAVTAAAAVLFTLGAYALIRVVDQAILQEVKTADRAFLQLLASTIGGPDGITLSSDISGDAEYAVLDQDGNIITATADYPAPDITDATFAFDVTVEHTPATEERPQEYVLSRVDTNTPEGEVILIATRPLSEVGERVQGLKATVLLLAPALALLSGAGTWVLTGRALLPVDRMTSAAKRITRHDLSERLPEPETHDEINRLAVTLNELLDRIEASTRAQQQFISDASHELRSPISAIRTQLEVAVQHPRGETDERLLTSILTENDRLEQLVADLIALARLDENPDHLNLEPVDIDDLVLQHAAVLDRLHTNLSRLSAAQIQGDRGLLSRLVRNILANAASHAREKVAVSLNQIDDAVVFIVDDDGPGIPSDSRDIVFDRFIRLDEGRQRDSGGTGLGLAIAKAVTEAHRGTIVASESPLGGTRIAITLTSQPSHQPREWR